MSGIASIKGDSSWYQTSHCGTYAIPLSSKWLRSARNDPLPGAFISSNRGNERVSELAELIEQAEHLLWVMARSDVEGLSAPRMDILRRLQRLESRALDFGVADLYPRVLQQCSSLTRIVL